MAFILEDDPQQQPQGRFVLEDAQKDPRIGRPEELSFSEKYLAPMLDKLGSAVQSDTGPVGAAARLVLNDGNARGAVAGRLFQGAADPGTAIAQMVAHATGYGPELDAKVAEREREYQAARAEAGSTGFDPARVAGNIAVTAPVGGAATNFWRGAAIGGGLGLLDPVREEGKDFWTEKLKQGGIGLLTGGLATPILGAAARIVSPNASVNPDLKMLREAGINTTVGQALGGAANTLEEKAMSLPVMGDMIAAARRGGVKDFNRAVLDTAVAPVGGVAKGAGFDAVADAGATLRGAYDKAAQDVGHVNFDTPNFNAKFGELMDMVSAPGALTPDLREKFQGVVNNELLRRMSPNASIAGADIKKVDSALGSIAAQWRASPAPGDREFGMAVRQLQQVFRDGLAEANPQYKAAKDLADEGWRAFRLARNAAAAAKNREGIFTPAQFNAAVQADAGKAAVGEGKAFMQGAGQAAQNVLGNKYPDSGTVGRLLVSPAAILAHIGTGGATTAGLGLGTLAYTRPVQNALVALLTRRPDRAPAAANYLRRLLGPATVASVPLVEQQAFH
jgi:hypothetical protein